MAEFNYPSAPAFEDAILPNPPKLKKNQSDKNFKAIENYFGQLFFTFNDLNVSIKNGWLISDARVVSLTADKVFANNIITENLKVGSAENIELNGTNNRIDIRDNAGTLRVRLGRFGSGSTNWGIQVSDAGGTVRFSSSTTTFINGGIITNATIAGSSLQNGAVDTTQLADNSVSTVKIINAAVTGSKIANSTITGSLIANSTLTNVNIANSTITNSLMANNSIATSNIFDSAVNQFKRMVVSSVSSNFSSQTVSANASITVTKQHTISHTRTPLCVVYNTTIGTGIRDIVLYMGNVTSTQLQVILAASNPGASSYSTGTQNYTILYW